MTGDNDATSFNDYRRNLREHHVRLRCSGRPLHVTRDGHADAVVLSPSAYDELAERAELVQALSMIARSEADLQAGRPFDARAALREIAGKYGLPLDR